MDFECAAIDKRYCLPGFRINSRIKIASLMPCRWQLGRGLSCRVLLQEANNLFFAGKESVSSSVPVVREQANCNPERFQGRTSSHRQPSNWLVVMSRLPRCNLSLFHGIRHSNVPTGHVGDYRFIRFTYDLPNLREIGACVLNRNAAFTEKFLPVMFF